MGGNSTKWPSAVQKQQASLSECVPELELLNPPQVSPRRLTELYCEAAEEMYKRRRRRRRRKDDSIGHC